MRVWNREPCASLPVTNFNIYVHLWEKSSQLLFLLLLMKIQKKKIQTLFFICALSQPFFTWVQYIKRRSCCLAPPTEDWLAELISASRQAPLLMFVEFKLRLCGVRTHAHTHTHTFSWLRFIRAGFHALFAKESTAALHSGRGLITVFGNQLNWLRLGSDIPPHLVPAAGANQRFSRAVGKNTLSWSSSESEEDAKW